MRENKKQARSKVLYFLHVKSKIIAYLVLFIFWFNVSFLLRLKFDMDAGRGDRCNSLKSPEYLQAQING